MMFKEWTFLDRFDAAAEAGFSAVECLFPYEASSEAVAERLTRNGLTQALFNLPAGNWQAGERGIAVFSERFSELRASVDRGLEYAEATGARRLHLMAGLADAGDRDSALNYRRAISYAAGKLAERGIDLLIEPINPRDMPGYYLADFGQASRLIAELGLPNLKLQFDIYHRQILHGDVAVALAGLMPITGHLQIASVPARNEPGDGELNYSFLFRELDRLRYAGFVGCEYLPRGSTLAGLEWFAPFRVPK
jgi:hydroxypyruvate isomerase